MQCALDPWYWEAPIQLFDVCELAPGSAEIRMRFYPRVHDAAAKYYRRSLE
jgi:hypothetical protein